MSVYPGFTVLPSTLLGFIHFIPSHNTVVCSVSVLIGPKHGAERGSTPAELLPAGSVCSG